MSRPTWARLRLAVGAAILLVLVWRLGTGPFLDGVRTVDTTALVLGALIAVPTTLCCAWRWRLVARALDVGVSLPAATGAYYRSQFLNTVLPGGVLGDVHRGVRHGREVADTAGSLRSVAWERGVGQVVQLAVAAVVLLPAALARACPRAARCWSPWWSSAWWSRSSPVGTRACSAPTSGCCWHAGPGPRSWWSPRSRWSVTC